MKQCHILIVEDETIIAIDLQETLRKLGYCVSEFVCSGIEALKRIEELPYDLVLMDIFLKGDMDGITTAKHIRARFDIPIVFITASTDNTTLDDAKQINPYGYIIKPYNKWELYSTIEIAINKHKMELRIKESEERYRSIFDQAWDGIILIDIDTFQIVDCNQAFEKQSQRDIDQLRNMKIWEIYPEKKQQEYMRKFLEIKEKGYAGPDEFEFERNNADIFYIEFSSRIVKLKEKPYIQSISRDITYRRKAEIALKKSEENYRLINENIPVAVYSALPDEYFSKTFVSGRIKELTGYDGKQFIKNPSLWKKILHPDDKVYIWGKIKEHLKEKVQLNIEYRIISKDNKIKWIKDKANPVLNENNKIVRVDGFMEDITDRKLVEIALKESNDRFYRLFEQSNDAIFLHTSDKKILDVNSCACEMLAYSRGDLISMHVSDLYPEDVAAYAMEKFEECKEKGAVRFESQFKSADGKIIEVDISSSIVDKTKGMFQEIVRDITERKKAEAAVRERERQLQIVIGSMPVLLEAFDKQGNIIFWNNECERVTGYTKEEIVGNPKAIEMLYPNPEYRKDILKKWAEKNNDFHDWEINLTTRDGVLKTISWSNISNKFPIPIWDSWSIGIDVTEKRKMERELIKVQKLESIATLAGGIAHDFNNMLTGIMGNISLAQYICPHKETLDILKHSEKATFRAKDLTQQLLTFSKGGHPIVKTCSIREIITDTAIFALRGSNVKCEFGLSDDLSYVEIDEGQIRQVISNLIINANQAMPEGGIITITGENILLRDCDSLPLTKGNYIKIQIKDRGLGIPPENIHKIFDPYFSTIEKKSGLGLSLCYSIIKKHRGYITVESKLNSGTTFSLYLPASEKKFPEKKKEGKDILFGKDKGKILVMDDEELIRNALSLMLNIIGYETILVKDGSEAIQMYKKAIEDKRPFSAVIMDLTIPGGMGGKEAIKTLKEIEPEIKAIVSSGYSNDPIMSNPQRYGFKGIISKPYEIKELSRVLNNIIVEQDNI